MEEMKLNSKTGYRKSRVTSGYGPHRLLEMLHQTKLGDLIEDESHDNDSASDVKKDAISFQNKHREVKK